jgi:hypothetical protein
MAFPKILAVSAAVSKFHISFAAIPVNLTVLVILASPTAVPIDFQEIASFNFFNDQGH